MEIFRLILAAPVADTLSVHERRGPRPRAASPVVLHRRLISKHPLDGFDEPPMPRQPYRVAVHDSARAASHQRHHDEVGLPDDALVTPIVHAKLSPVQDEEPRQVSAHLRVERAVGSRAGSISVGGMPVFFQAGDLGSMLACCARLGNSRFRQRYAVVRWPN
jgi:hypothetical protein